MKIAIVGSGISGMTAAYLLSREHEVHVFEADNRIGGHTNTIDVEVESGRYAIDTGFIVHNTKNYPNFLKLMDQLGVATKDSEMSFSVKAQVNGLEYNGATINSLFCQRKNFLNINFHRMWIQILRFNKEATEFYLSHKESVDLPTTTLEGFLKDRGYSWEFCEYYIIPMGAAIWSASRAEMHEMPLHFFLSFFHHHGLLQVNDRPQWRVLVGGSRSYIPKLTEKYAQNIHLNSPVYSATRNQAGVTLTIENKGERTSLDFDHVVFSNHADHIRRAIQNPTPAESEVLLGFSSRPNDVILHTDTSVLPVSPLAHAAWNYYLPEKERARVAVTYHMNILQGINSPEKFMVSLNMDDIIDPKKIIKHIAYNHPIYNYSAVHSNLRWSEISGADKIHFCGAYWGNGFHEDGVKSAINVARSFGIEL